LSALKAQVDPEAAAACWLIAPLALQGLLENAVKHIQASATQPLPVRLAMGDGAVSVANPVRPRRSALPSASVVGHADSVRGTQTWLAEHPTPDLPLADIQLTDGLSLELFADGTLAVPTVFTTAYDRFAIDAFSALAVDYLFKPVADMALAQALQKVERLRRSFGSDVAALLLQQLGPAPPRWRQRMVGRKGAQFHALTVERLAYVVSVDKLVFAVDAAGERHLVGTPLAELEAALDPQRFFRANRQMLLAADAVVRFAPAGKGRIKVELRTPGAGAVIVSQERAAAFKAWLAG
jgi:DNA-binding LytR/AlgR family response regulator